MTTISIDFDALRDASSKASSAAGRLEGYADALSSSVLHPLGGLTGGSSPNTASASSLALEKSRELRNKADGYRSLSRSIQTFESSACRADKQVFRSIEKVADKRAVDLPWWNKAGRVLHGLFDGTLSKTDVGKVIKQFVNWKTAVYAKRDQVLKKVFDWFKRGNGRYVLQMVESGLAVAGAIAAIFAVTGPLAIVAGVLLTIVAFKKAMDAGVAVAQSAVAISENDTEPGLAYYHGSQTSMSKYVKQHSTSRKLQNTFKTIDNATVVMDLVAGGIGLFSRPSALKENASLKEIVIANLKSKIGLSPTQLADGTIKYSFNPLGLKSGALTIKDKISVASRAVGTTKGVVDIDRTFNKLITGGMGGSPNSGRYSGAKDFVGLIGGVFGGIGGIGDLKKVMSYQF